MGSATHLIESQIGGFVQPGKIVSPSYQSMKWTLDEQGRYNLFSQDVKKLLDGQTVT